VADDCLPRLFTIRYGRSTGSPSEKGLRIDAQTALDYVKKHPLLKDTKVVIYGQSIGGCVSIALAGASGDQVGFETSAGQSDRVADSALLLAY